MAGQELTGGGDRRAGTAVDGDGEAADFAQAILATMRQPVLVLDADLRVAMANPAFLTAFRVGESETSGRRVYELGNGQWDIPELRRLLEGILPAEATVEDFRVEHEFEEIGRRAVILNARRLTRPDRPTTIFLSIDDVTEKEQADKLLHNERVYIEKIVDSARDALLILDFDLHVKSANETFYDKFGVERADTEGRKVYALGNGQWDIPQLRILLENVLPDNDAFDDYEVEHDFPDLGHRTMVLNARRVDHMQLILLAIEDQTDARLAARALRESEARLSSLMRHAPIGIGLLDREGSWVVRNPLLEGFASAPLLPGDGDAPEPGAQEADWPGARALRGEIVTPGTDTRTQIDDRETWLRISAAPVGDGERVEQAVVIVEDVTEAKASEQERELLLGELNHRVKNLFGIIRSLIAQGRGGEEVEEYKRVLNGRLDALVRSHALATEARWGSIDLKTIATRTLEPYMASDPEAISIDGVSLMLEARLALSLSLSLHELATNSVKYGALSDPAGRMRLAWRIVDDETGKRAELAWEESGGPVVRPPTRQGFGTKLLERIFTYEMDGEVELEFRPEGLRVDARFPVP